jgi:hypothetical protein
MIRVEDSLADHYLSTMVRLMDGLVKLGTARHEHYISCLRLMVNQMITGTVSRHKLAPFNPEGLLYISKDGLIHSFCSAWAGDYRLSDFPSYTKPL